MKQTIYVVADFDATQAIEAVVLADQVGPDDVIVRYQRGQFQRTLYRDQWFRNHEDAVAFLRTKYARELEKIAARKAKVDGFLTKLAALADRSG